MEFKASFDTYAKVVITLVTILFLGITAFFAQLMAQSDDPKTLLAPFILILVINVGIYVVCYLYQPLKYVISSGKVIVKRPIKDKIIALADIKNVYATTPESMGRVMKTFGNGGLFGFYGEFRSNRYGEMTWYATRKSNYVMLETSEGRIVITPDDLQMVNEIKKLLVQE